MALAGGAGPTSLLGSFLTKQPIQSSSASLLHSQFALSVICLPEFVVLDKGLFDDEIRVPFRNNRLGPESALILDRVQAESFEQVTTRARLGLTLADL